MEKMSNQLELHCNLYKLLKFYSSKYKTIVEQPQNDDKSSGELWEKYDILHLKYKEALK